MESLVNCLRCGGNACLHDISENKIEGWLCFGCGFATSTEMKEGTEVALNIGEVLPELYKDLLYIDSEGKIWYPSTITLPNKGIVFLDGSSIEDWTWTAALSIPIPDEDKHRFSNEQTTKIDYTQKKVFHKKDFMDALEYIGFFQLQEDTL